MREALAELRERPTRLWVLLACVLVMVVHQAVRWNWYIDDSGICFAYARNIAMGEGIVPWPGGERIEAVSDPTWVLLLAALYWIGLDGFEVAKPLAMLLGVGTLGVTWRIARLAMPEHQGPGALIAPILVAVSAQFAIWSASGLENSLWCFLLAVAMYRSLIEARDGTFPWAAVAWLAIGWTRPEGLLYAAVAGFWFLVWTVRDGRPLRLVAYWLALYWIPTVMLVLLRLWYFAWPLPNTYYAKIGSRGTAPIDWGERGWGQLREWSARLWHGYWTPVYVLGLTGVTGRRAAIGLSVVGLLALSLLWPGPTRLQAMWFWPALSDPPRMVEGARIAALVAAGGGLPLLAIGRPGGRPLVLCGHLLWVGLAFSIIANGDWMGAYRWMSLIVVPAAVLLAAGMTQVIDALQVRVTGTPRWQHAGWLLASLLVGLQLPPNLSQTRDHTFYNMNETIASVVERVKYLRRVTHTTFWEEPIVNLEVDQGANLWFAPEHRSVDMAMLVDVSMSHHWFQQRPFIQEYIFDEQRPTFAHVGGWWAPHSGLREYEDWSPTFVELPPYIDPRWNGPFTNVFARRELFVTPRWTGTTGRRRDLGPAVLEGWEQPAPWTPGREGYIEAPISLLAARPKQGKPLNMGLEIRNGDHRERFDLDLGYDGLYPPVAWKPGEVFRGRYALSVPDDLPAGDYDLRFVVVVDGKVIAETSFPSSLRVVSPEAFAGALDQGRKQVRIKAGEGRCDAAEDAWISFKRHRPRDWDWHASEAVRSERALADCWALRAEDEAEAAPALLARAHRWDHHSAELRRVGGPVADRLFAEGMTAHAEADWERSYERFSALLKFQPWRSWARRRAEEARDHRLGLTNDVRIGIGGLDDAQRHRKPGQGG